MNQQAKLESLIETVFSTCIGFGVAFTAGPLMYAYLDIPYDNTSNVVITCGFTVLSVARGYVVRRFFATGLHQTAANLARKIAWQ